MANVARKTVKTSGEQDDPSSVGQLGMSDGQARRVGLAFEDLGGHSWTECGCL